MEGRCAGALIALGLMGACGDNREPFVDDEPISAPHLVSASDGTSLDAVSVTWKPVAGAASYRIWRDDVQIAYVPGARFEDYAAGAGTFQAPILTASSGTYVDRVQLLWSPPRGAAGPTHTYAVSAVSWGGVESTRSNADTGFRGEPQFVRWEVSTDGGETYPIVATRTAYADAAAPFGTITPGVVTASDGSFDTHVAVSLSGATVSDGAVAHYVVAAVTTGGRVLSNPADGYRGVGTLHYTWQRYLPDLGPTSSVNLTSPTGTSLDDSNAQPGQTYAYYCTVSALGARPSSIDTEPDTGWRGP